MKRERGNCSVNILLTDWATLEEGNGQLSTWGREQQQHTSLFLCSLNMQAPNCGSSWRPAGKCQCNGNCEAGEYEGDE